MTGLRDAECFVVVGRTRTAHDASSKLRRSQFQAAAQSVMERVGAEVSLVGFAAAAEVAPLAGHWEWGDLVIEHYNSYRLLVEFWSSRDYQAALAMRSGLPVLNFVVALPSAPGALVGEATSALTLLAVEGGDVLASEEEDQAVALAPQRGVAHHVLHGTWPYAGAPQLRVDRRDLAPVPASAELVVRVPRPTAQPRHFANRRTANRAR